jgi:SNF2 family DNA or RNA helicase
MPRASRFGVHVSEAFEHSPKTRWLVGELEEMIGGAAAAETAGGEPGADGEPAAGGGEADGGSKAVLFSQWTAMLDLVEHALRTASIRFVRLDGSLSVAKREEAIARFRKDASVRVFLISLKAGGVGLNLTAANRVYLLDPWWNPAVMDQAIDRVHRLGQTRPVVVKQCVMEDSVEGRILRLQERKRCLQGALRLNLAQDEAQKPAKLDLDDLKLLFEK